jgi:F0F1-type ATP synthase assembly protein I
MKSIPAPMTIAMFVIFTVMVGVAATYPPAARFMPFTIGIPAIALCLVQLALDFYRQRHPESADSGDALQQAEDQVARMAGRRVEFEMPSENAMFADTAFDEREKLRREVIVWGYFLGLIAGILLLGFLITVPVFLIAFLRFQAGASWRSAIAYGGLGSLAMYVLFEKVLKVSLHTGFLTDFFVARLAS